MAKDKKIIFSEEIDSIINGLSLGVTFVIIALLVWFGNLFHNKIAEMIFAMIMLFIGIAGTFLEVEKANKELKGFGDFGMGTVFSGLAIFLIFKFNIIFLNILCVIILIFGIYCLVSGLLKIIYSMKWQRRKTENRKIEILQFVTGATEVIALIVVILELITEVN